jgi:hypothetical protein
MSVRLSHKLYLHQVELRCMLTYIIIILLQIYQHLLIDIHGLVEEEIFSIVFVYASCKDNLIFVLRQC